MPLKTKRQSGQVNPGNVTQTGDSQQSITAAAAKKWNVSPQTLWGIYYAETRWGQNVSDSGVGAAGGAKGYMQFEDATAKQYGVNPQDFASSMFGAAHYLHDLGANSNPNSQQTKAAIVGYNTGRAGDFGGAASGYLDEVLTYGPKIGISSPADVADPNASNRGNGGNGGSLGGGSLLDVLTALASGNIDAFAADIALFGVEVAKNISIGVWDLIFAPLWHWEQRAVAYYTNEVLDPKRYGDTSSDYTWAFAWTAAFWGFGYTLLFTSPGSGLKPVAVKRSRLGRHVRRGQALPARKSLVKPKDVEEQTPKKPSVTVSSANLTHVGTLTTTRARPVRVEGDTHGSGGKAPQAPIDRLNKTSTASTHPKPNSQHHSGQGTHQGSGGTSQETSEGGK